MTGNVKNVKQRNATLNGNVRCQANFKTLDNAAHGPGQGYISDDRGGHKIRQLGKRMERSIDHEQHADACRAIIAVEHVAAGQALEPHRLRPQWEDAS